MNKASISALQERWLFVRTLTVYACARYNYFTGPACVSHRVIRKLVSVYYNLYDSKKGGINYQKTLCHTHIKETNI